MPISEATAESTLAPVGSATLAAADSISRSLERHADILADTLSAIAIRSAQEWDAIGQTVSSTLVRPSVSPFFQIAGLAVPVIGLALTLWLARRSLAITTRLAERSLESSRDVAKATMLANAEMAARAEALARRPVLVFQLLAKKPRYQWQIMNVGNGPATNVVVAERSMAEKSWVRPVAFPPMAKDAFHLLPWITTGALPLCVAFTDYKDAHFYTEWKEGYTETKEGYPFPEWLAGTIAYHWERDA